MVKSSWFNPQVVPFAVLIVLAATLRPVTALAGALERIHQDDILRVAYRADAPPFSYQNSDGKPAGFMVDLCQAVVNRLAQQLDLPSLKTSYLTVTAANRFEAIQQNTTPARCSLAGVDNLSRR